MASARSKRRWSWALFRRAPASSAASGLGGGGLGPRLVGVSAPKAPASRCRRQSERADEYSPSRRRMAPMPPAPCRLIGFRQDAQLVLGRERPPTRAIRQLRGGSNRPRNNRRPAAFLCSGAGCCGGMCNLIGHDHDDDSPIPSRLNFRGVNVSSSLAQRGPNSNTRAACHFSPCGMLCLLAQRAMAEPGAERRWLASAASSEREIVETVSIDLQSRDLELLRTESAMLAIRLKLTFEMWRSMPHPSVPTMVRHLPPVV